ncbi:MAG: CRISPR-associated endoribonuclease Cas6 [Candidatus Bipolaricaulota bacterium]|nr:CRISPR-associated endoribonuclease Cas6 [Candidatus Bipolaricaulota bacterium]
MRIILTLTPGQVPCTIPFSYAHALTAVVYSFLDRSSHDYARFLHDEGYRLGAKRFKLFTFSQLLIPQRQITPEGLVCLSEQIAWQISSPVAEFVEHLAAGLLQLGQMRLGEHRFFIQRVQVAPRPIFSEEMRLRCLSPMVASLPQAGKRTAYYARADDPRLSEALRQNLLKKFWLVHGRAPGSSELTVEFDREYLKRKGEEVYRLVNYKGTQIKAILAPLLVRGSPELIEMGYEAGFGEKNSMGFGMVEGIS